MDALRMAVWRRGKADVLRHHPDQGSHYTSEQIQRLLAGNGITCPMKRAGKVRDRAMATPLLRVTMARSAMESCFSTLKIERTDDKICRTRNKARAGIFDVLDRFHNPARWLSQPGYNSPMEIEARAIPA